MHIYILYIYNIRVCRIYRRTAKKEVFLNEQREARKEHIFLSFIIITII